MRDEVVQHLGVYNPIDRVKEKDAACYQRTLDFINEKIIPRRLILATIFFLIGRLCGLYKGSVSLITYIAEEGASLPILPLFFNPIHIALNA